MQTHMGPQKIRQKQSLYNSNLLKSQYLVDNIKSSSQPELRFQGFSLDVSCSFLHSLLTDPHTASVLFYKVPGSGEASPWHRECSGMLTNETVINPMLFWVVEIKYYHMVGQNRVVFFCICISCFSFDKISNTTVWNADMNHEKPPVCFTDSCRCYRPSTGSVLYRKS